MNSKAIFYSDDAAFCAPLRRALAAHGWQVAIAAEADVALAEQVALVVLDAGAEGAADWLARARAQPQPVGGVPVVQSGGARWPGTSALVAPGDDAALLATVETFTGHLADHELRRAPFSPFYRLVRLLGTRDAATMLDRFADSLRAALAEGAGVTPEEAHRLAGLAGAVGYTELAYAWRSAEHGGADTVGAALIATRTTLAAIERDVARARPS